MASTQDLENSDNPLDTLRIIAEKRYKSKSKKRKSQVKPTSTHRVKREKPPDPTPNTVGVHSLSDDQLKSVYDEVLVDRELGMRSMRDYARICWPLVEPGIDYVENAWHSDCLSDHFQAVIEGQIKRLLIAIPPGHGKTTWASIFLPGFAWLQNPYFKMVFGSYKFEGLSLDHALKFIKLLKSKFWQDRWGHLFKLDQTNQAKVTNEIGGVRAVLSVKGQTLGFRADIAIADDPLNIHQGGKSEVERATVKRWWMSGMMSRGNIHQRGVVIAQRLHDDDLIGHLLDVGGWEYLCLPFEFVPSRRCVTYTVNGEEFFKDPRTEEGEVLFPKLFPARYVREKERDPETANMVPAMYQQDPVPEGGNIIKTNWFRFYQESPEEMFSKCSQAIFSADTAIKSKTSSSFTVAQIWGVRKSNIYLIDQIRMRLSFTGILQVLISLINKWNSMPGPTVGAKLVEDKASGPDVIEMLKDKIPGLIPSEGNDDKEDRMHAITWLWEAGNIYVPGRPLKPEDQKDGFQIDFSMTPWMDEWYDEITRYPTAKYTDQAMAMSQALMYLAKQMKKGVGMPSIVSGTDAGYLDKFTRSTKLPFRSSLG